MDFFTSLPNVYYKLNQTEYKLVKNLFRRLRIRSSTNAISISTEAYTVQPFEKIEDVAFRFYKDPTYWWVIAVINEITSIRDEWYATEEEIEKLYASPDFISYYETLEIKDNNGFVRVPSGLVVESTYSFTYFNTATQNNITLSGSSLVVPISFNYDIFRKNEAKRYINILLPQYLGLVKNELSTLLDYNTNLNVVDNIKFTE